MENISDQNKVKNIVVKSATSFYWGMNLMEKNQRRAMFSVYSFCRKVDDIADSNESKKKKLDKLSSWVKKINLLYKNRTSDFLSRELLFAIRKYALIKKDFLDIIYGMKMDIIEKIIYPDQKKFFLYCDRVAGAVGCLSMNIFEINHIKSREYAKYLGRAFQLTNILRDLKEDSLLGRCYIPKNLILRFTSTDQRPEKIIKDSQIGNICCELKKITKENYEIAEKISKNFDKKKMKAPFLMKSMYETIFKKISMKDWDLEKKVKLSKIEKSLILIKFIFR